MVAQLWALRKPVSAAFGWNPWPREHHEEHIELLREANGGALPTWAIQADLVHLADAVTHPKRPRRFPGRRALKARWGVSDWATRCALRDPAWQATCVSMGIPVPVRSPDRPAQKPGQPVNQPTTNPVTNPVTDHRKKGEPQQSADNQPGDQPTPLHTRVGSNPPSQEEEEEEEEDPPRVPKAEDRPSGEDLAVIMAQLMALQEADEPQHGMSQPKDRVALERALRRGVPLERLRQLWRWSGESDHGQAQACRTNDWRRWSSLLKSPHGEERLALAEAWARRKPSGRPEYRSFDDIRDEPPLERTPPPTTPPPKPRSF